jgi:hypothetical protein
MFAEAKDAFTLSDVREPTLSLSERRRRSRSLSSLQQIVNMDCD